MSQTLAVFRAVCNFAMLSIYIRRISGNMLEYQDFSPVRCQEITLLSSEWHLFMRMIGAVEVRTQRPEHIKLTVLIASTGNLVLDIGPTFRIHL